MTLDVVLADGATAQLRSIQPEDGPALRSLHDRLSDRSRYFRFFTAHPRLTDDEAAYFTVVDHADREALVMEVNGAIVAVARYDRMHDTDEAEVAFTVDDAHQGRGIGTLLLEHLATLAQRRGISRFTASVLGENRKMLKVFADAGFTAETGFGQGAVDVVLDLTPSPRAAAAIDERDREATVRSVGRLLGPSSVAVVGASREPDSIGHALFHNLLTGDFQGPVYPVNAAAPFVSGVLAYPSVAEVPGEVDLAVIAVPAAAVPDVVAQCASKSVHGLVVISAGFAETGPEGAEAERGLVRTARDHGMRLIGPNSMGVVNTDPATRLNATFAPVAPPEGRVAFMSQSGALGIALLDELRQVGLGVSSFVSAGNKADVSGNDLIRYWEQDERTSVILLYLESFGNPRRFSRLARLVSKRKPIVAVKSGRSEAGRRGAMSHTAALASADEAVDALFRQTGVIRVDTLDQLYDVARVLDQQPLPAGPRVGIVGNAGGPGILAADACVEAGLEVPELSRATRERLDELLPDTAGIRNPVDLVASATPEQFQAALEAVLADESIDMVLVLFVPPLVTRAEDVAGAVLRAREGSTKPVVANFLARSAQGSLADGTSQIPVFAHPEAAAQALGRVAWYAEWRSRPTGAVAPLEDADRGAARTLVDAVLADRPAGRWLDAMEAHDLVAAYGVRVASMRWVADARAGVDAAEALGYPVALKAGSPELVHKSDRGGVALDLATDRDVEEAFTLMERQLGDEMGGAIIQPMVPSGVETIVGVVHDPSFGPLLVFGMGGTAVELLGDRAFHIVPLTDRDARGLVRSPRGSPLLFGYRGAPECDVAALEDLIRRVSCLADEVPEIAELDLNPVVVSPEGAVAIDVKLRLAPPPRALDPLSRRLPPVESGG